GPGRRLRLQLQFRLQQLQCSVAGGEVRSAGKSFPISPGRERGPPALALRAKWPCANRPHEPDAPAKDDVVLRWRVRLVGPIRARPFSPQRQRGRSALTPWAYRERFASASYLTAGNRTLELLEPKLKLKPKPPPRT